ncbi:MAG: protease modulator HflC [Phycisphaerae bacterium]
MPRNAWAMIVAAIVIVIIVLMMCAYQVPFTETVVITHFNKLSKVIEPDNAGLHWKWPWPIDRVYRYDARLRTFETEFRQQGTKDQRTIILTAYATWRIADARTFLNTVGPDDEAGVAKIRDRLESIVSGVLQTHPIGDLVNVDPDRMKLAAIEEEMRDGIRDDVRKAYGIEIDAVGIKRLNFPESVTREVFARMKEDRQKTIKELTAEGTAIAAQIRADADETAQKILARSDAYAKQIKAEGDAQAARYYKFFEENRELSDFLKMRDTLLEIFSAGQITLVLDAANILPFGLLNRTPPQPATSSAAGEQRSQLDPDARGPAAPPAAHWTETEAKTDSPTD